jgi:hypothetical protein
MPVLGAAHAVEPCSTRTRQRAPLTLATPQHTGFELAVAGTETAGAAAAAMLSSRRTAAP